MRYLKQLSIVAITFLLYSCNNFDSNINTHFKKFITVGKFKEYKIESITRKDTVTVKANELQKIRANIKNLKYRILECENGILINKGVINAITDSDVITKSAIINGQNFKYKIYSVPNAWSAPSYKYGKEADIKHEEEIIDFWKQEILQASKRLRDEELKIKIVEKENNSTILLISSEVIISGYTASGEDKHLYVVTHDATGKIKKVMKR